MQKKIIIPSANERKKWSDFLRINSYTANVSVLIVDFSSCNFLEPSHIVQIACLIEQYYQKEVEISFIESKNPILRNYLSNINFLNYWTPNFEIGRHTSELQSPC